MQTKRVPFVLLLLILAACTTGSSRDEAIHAQALLAETTPMTPPPVSEAPGLRDPANRVADVARPAPGAANCPAQIFTFVRAETGTDCETYKAEIAGWADRCVGECDDAARLAEAIASARATCADFCRRKNCRGPVYSPPAQCATSRCFKGSACDPRECPFRNYCMLQQGGRVWNCVCVEIES
ncbi:MAG: hypothetical protein ACXW5U_28655 [Thermoanaerobaculia bacterium]